MFSLVGVPIFIKIGQHLAVLEHVLHFQDGGGGGDHLGKWRQSPGSALFKLSIFRLVCVPSFIKIGLHLAVLEHVLNFQDGGGGHLGKWR